MTDEQLIQKLQILDRQGKDGLPEIREVLKTEGGVARLIELAARGLGKRAKAVSKTQPQFLPELQFPDWWPAAQWQAFVAMRTKKKAPLTEYATDLIIRDITRWRLAGQNPIEIIDRSIRNCWSDVYELGKAEKTIFPQIGETPEVWRWRINAFHKGDPDEQIRPGYWKDAWGPKPGEPGCRAPN